MPTSLYSGAWARDYVIQQSGAQRWGTGVNAIHAYRMTEERGPVRETPESQLPDNISPASTGVPDFITEHYYGYQPEDIAGLDVFTEAATLGIPVKMDNDHPEFGTTTTVTRANVPPTRHVPWGSSGFFKNAVRSIRGGQHDEDARASNEIPTETVSEGWINKLGSGFDIGASGDEVKPSDPAQYERQTSMQQRFKTLNNQRAVLRGADDVRSDVSSRIVPMKAKVYSEGQRNYDMFPFQIDDIVRPFRYRTAGVGPQTYLEPNEQFQRTAIQRTPPPDPSLGTPDTELTSTFGYEAEDQGYY